MEKQQLQYMWSMGCCCASFQFDCRVLFGSQFFGFAGCCLRACWSFRCCCFCHVFLLGYHNIKPPKKTQLFAGCSITNADHCQLLLHMFLRLAYLCTYICMLVCMQVCCALLMSYDLDIIFTMELIEKFVSEHLTLAGTGITCEKKTNDGWMVS